MCNTVSKLCWPDGSFISRDKTETLIHAVNRICRQANAVITELQECDTGNSETILVEREDSDASSDKLSWHLFSQHSLC